MDGKKSNESEVFIDSHVHIFPQDRLGGLMRWILRLIPEHPVPESVSAETILHEIRREGITHFFNLVYPLKEEETAPLNTFNGRFCSSIPGAIPFASMHPDTADKAKVAEEAFAALLRTGGLQSRVPQPSPALVEMRDAVSRLIPGVLGDPTGAEDDSHSMGLLEYPHYTRPPEYRGWEVPEVLLSGNHARIEKWRRELIVRKI